MNNLKEKIKNGEVTFGSWITLSDTSIAEIMAKSRKDCARYPMKHYWSLLERRETDYERRYPSEFR